MLLGARQAYEFELCKLACVTHAANHHRVEYYNPETGQSQWRTLRDTKIQAPSAAERRVRQVERDRRRALREAKAARDHEAKLAKHARQALSAASRAIVERVTQGAPTADPRREATRRGVKRAADEQRAATAAIVESVGRRLTRHPTTEAHVKRQRYTSRVRERESVGRAISARFAAGSFASSWR